MSVTDGKAEPAAAAPERGDAVAVHRRSPTTAFLSDCHTGALIAPDGAIDWLCVPQFDAPSVFGALLDRGAGSFRLGPFGINHPVARAYDPGTNVLVTTWRTPSGWIVVRDALTIGPRRTEDTVTPHTRPPADDDAEHLLVRTVECIDGDVEVELVCEPVFDYGREPAEWSLVGDGPPHRGRDRRGRDDPAADRHGRRHRGQPRACPARPQGRRAAVLLAVVGGGARLPRRRRRRGGADRRPPRASGATGSTARACPTTGGASRSSARRSRSRASPTCRPARPSPRSPPRCRRPRAASATGTTATRGSATRRSRCRRCTG